MTFFKECIFAVKNYLDILRSPSLSNNIEIDIVIFSLWRNLAFDFCLADGLYWANFPAQQNFNVVTISVG